MSAALVTDVGAEIRALKAEPAHNYQWPEIRDLADVVADSRRGVGAPGGDGARAASTVTWKIEHAAVILRPIALDRLWPNSD